MAWPKGKPKSPLTRMRISQSKRKRTEPVKPPVVHVPTDRVSKLTPNAGKNVLDLLPRPPLPPGLDDTPLPRRLVGTNGRMGAWGDTLGPLAEFQERVSHAMRRHWRVRRAKSQCPSCGGFSCRPGLCLVLDSPEPTPTTESPETEPITDAPRTRAYEVAPRRGR